MEGEQSAQGHEIAQTSSPPWLGLYRGYLYFALALNAIDLMWLATKWGESGAGSLMIYAAFWTLLPVVIVAFLAISLKRIGEAWITKLHLAVNAVTLCLAFCFVVAGIHVITAAGWLYKWLSLPSLHITGLTLKAGIYSTHYVFVLLNLAIVLISVYWLKNWYQFGGWRIKDSHLWYVVKPVVLTTLVTAGIALVPFTFTAVFGLGVGSSMILSIGAIPVAISAVVSCFRAFKWLWQTAVGNGSKNVS